MLRIICVLLLVSTTIEATRFELQTVYAHHRTRNHLIYHHVNTNISLTAPRSVRETRTVSNFTWETRGPLPDITNRDVLMLLADMSSNAYHPPSSTQWISIPGWTEPNQTSSYDPNSYALHSYVFYSSDWNEVVIAFKGTDVFGPTANNDLTQDWLMFSCCGESASAVPIAGVPHAGCGCDEYYAEEGVNICHVGCFFNCINRQNTYVAAAAEIFNHAYQLHSTSAFFFTGHSLGGAISGLMSVAFRFPAVTFESPPSYHYARAMGLSVDMTKNQHLPIFGFGAYNDAIFMGGDTCWPCAYGGSPIKTTCHLGYIGIWPLVRDNTYGYTSQTSNAHSIDTARSHIFNLEIPTLYSYTECYECPGWVFWMN